MTISPLVKHFDNATDPKTNKRPHEHAAKPFGEGSPLFANEQRIARKPEAEARMRISWIYKERSFSDQERKAIVLALDALARSEEPNGEHPIALTSGRKRL